MNSASETESTTGTKKISDSGRQPAAATRSDTSLRSPEKQRTHSSAPVPTPARWLLPSLHHLTLLLLLALLLSNSHRFLQDSDTGWHIRTGDWIRQQHAIPQRDLFSFTMSDHQWFAWEWLTDLMMSLLHNVCGLAGLVGASILLLTFTYWWLSQQMITRGAGPLLAFGLALFAAMASMVHWLARPHLISITLMLCWVTLIETRRQHRPQTNAASKDWRSQAIWLIVPLTALWANLHGAFAVTFPMFLIYIAGEMAEAIVQGNFRNRQFRATLKTYAMVMVTSLAASLLNPYGARLYQHLWQYLNDHELLSRIDEFQSPDFHTVDGKLIELLLLLAIIAGWRAGQQRRFVEIGLLLFWSHLTLQSQRHVTLAVIVMMPIIAEQMAGLFQAAGTLILRSQSPIVRWCQATSAWYRGTLQIERQLRSPIIPVAVFLFLCVLMSGRWAGLTRKMLQPHPDARRLPVAAADFIAATSLNGNGYAPDQFGGYLIYRFWPERRVFFDGRSDFYRTGAVFDEALRIAEVKPDWSALLDKYQVQWLLLRNGDALAKVALAEGSWTSVYRDNTAQVLVRKATTDKPEKPGPQS